MNSTARLLEQLESKFASAPPALKSANKQQLDALHQLHLQDQQMLKTRAKHKIANTKQSYEAHVLTLQDRIAELEHALHQSWEQAQLQEYEFQRKSQEEDAYWQRAFHEYQHECSMEFDSKLVRMKQEMDSIVEENSILADKLNKSEMQVRRLEWEKRQVAERCELDMQALQRDFEYQKEQAKQARVQHNQQKLARALEEMDI